jgi:hypothetical protein
MNTIRARPFFQFAHLLVCQPYEFLIDLEEEGYPLLPFFLCYEACLLSVLRHASYTWIQNPNLCALLKATADSGRP